VAVWIALSTVDKAVNQGNSAINGFKNIDDAGSRSFHMIFSKPNVNSSSEYIQKYIALPGITMYFAGQWIANLNYWGCNQYITQRALGANLETARSGILFAGS
jgi:SSS family solute:Na+ symporter